MKVQVSQNITVMVQHARSEGGADAGAALFTLSCTRCPSTQRQVRGYFTPAGAPGQKDSQGDSFLIFNLVTKGNVTLLYLRK